MKANKRAIFYRIGALLFLLLLAGAMFIVGRGHTIYLDNKTLEYEGTTYSAFYRAKVIVNGTEAAKLQKRERGMATWIGQNYRMTVEVTPAKGEEPKTYPISLKLPYGMDGIVLNLPGLLADLPPEAYRSEFVPMDTPAESTEEEIVTDEFVLPDA